MSDQALQQESLSRLRALLSLPTNTAGDIATLQASVTSLSALLATAQSDITDLEAEQGMLYWDCLVVASDAPALDIATATALKIVMGDRVQICDGVADQVEINAAVAALPAGGGVIKVSVGTFFCADSVTPVHDATFIGAGVDASIFKQADGANIATGVFYANGSFNRGVVRGIGIDGNKANNPTGTYGMYLRGVWYARIEHVAIHDCKEDGFRSTTTAGGIYCGEIYHEQVSSYDNDKDGFALAGSGDNFLVDCYAYGNAEYGFHCSMTHNCMFHCHGYDNTLHGLVFDGSSDHNALFACFGDENQRHGIYLTGDYNRLIGCYARSNSKGASGVYDGIRVAGTHNTIVGALCRDTQTPKTQAYGIQESGSANFNVYSANLVGDNLTGAMLLTGEASRASMNEGYIHRGEIRQMSKALAGGLQNAMSFAIQNPEAQQVYVREVFIPVGTPGGTAGAHLDIGVCDDAAGTNLGVEFFDDLDANAAQMNTSKLAADGGTQTKPALLAVNGAGADAWVGGIIRDANASNLAGSAIIEYMGA